MSLVLDHHGEYFDTPEVLLAAKHRMQWIMELGNDTNDDAMHKEDDAATTVSLSSSESDTTTIRDESCSPTSTTTSITTETTSGSSDHYSWIVVPTTTQVTTQHLQHSFTKVLNTSMQYSWWATNRQCIILGLFLNWQF
mmetsp:Transcript_36727/g.62534  ORF Transcript_36727/g.62534 Transcript_36727/m.62534 type:complete len:139 (+) Transcript_36727:291-707(+)